MHTASRNRLPFLFAASVLSVLLVSGCAKRESMTSTNDTAASVQTTTTGNAVDQVAGDKELLRQALILADSKGTLEGALTEAAQDSVIGIKMRAALILGNEAKTKTSAPPSEGKKSSKSTGTAHHTSQNGTTNSGDALDKANSGLDKANQTVTKSGEVINKAQDLNRKVGDILNGRH